MLNHINQMRAKTIYEFERGIDPREILGIGPRKMLDDIYKWFYEEADEEEDAILRPIKDYKNYRLIVKEEKNFNFNPDLEYSLEKLNITGHFVSNILIELDIPNLQLVAKCSIKHTEIPKFRWRNNKLLKLEMKDLKPEIIGTVIYKIFYDDELIKGRKKEFRRLAYNMAKKEMFNKKWYNKLLKRNYVDESISFERGGDPKEILGIGSKEKIIKDFENKLRDEFPDLQDFEWHKKENFIELSLDYYSETGMNNLDYAVKKVIRNYFKPVLKYVGENLRDKLGMEDYWHEESIFVKIMI